MKILSDLRKGLKTSRFCLPILLLLVCLLIPLFEIPPYFIHVLAVTFFYISYSSSWNLLAYSGQVSFGHAAFLGIGGYVTTIFTIQTSIPWLGLLLGALVSAFAGILVGLTCVRLREWFLALVTLGFSIIMVALTIELNWLTGGVHGLAVPRLLPSVNHYYYGMLALTIFLVFIIYLITKSKIGLAFAAIRENESEAKATGIDVTKYKLLAFTMSAFFAGLIGAFYAHFISFINYQIFLLDYSFWPIIICVIGGIATIEGPIIGSALRFFILEFLRVIQPLVETIDPVIKLNYPKIQVLLMGIILVVVVIKMPKGISTWLRKYLISKG
ncbi:MAG: branched-chain amino acid ABC transporter permease [Nitrososphaerales archaeon]